MKKYDLFISHASEDKPVVGPLVAGLKAKGYRVWYDEDVLHVGDSLSKSIDDGLSASRFGVVVLSPAFIAKYWTSREFQGLVVLDELGRTKILPVWHNVTKDAVANFSPTLAGVMAADTAWGLPRVVDALAASVDWAAGSPPSDEEVRTSQAPARAGHAGARVVRGCGVFIHGMYANGAAWDPIVDLLERESDLHAWDFRRFVYRTGFFETASIETTALELITFVERLPSDRYDRLALVAHSVGGLIAREAILRSESLRCRLAALTLVAAPTGGLRLASLIGFLDPRLRDLSVGGSRIQAMNQEWSRVIGDRPAFAVQTLAGSEDNIVPMSGAASETRPIVVPGSHAGVLQGSAIPIARAIRDLLARSIPPDP